MRQRLLIPMLFAGALAASVPASAQIAPPKARPQRPVPFLFGNDFGKAEQQLVLNASFGAGYDDDLLAEAAGQGIGGPSTNRPRSGTFTQGTAALSYSVSRDRISASARGISTGRYYPRSTAPTAGTYLIMGQVSFEITSKTQLSTSLQSGLQPNTQSIFHGNPLDPTTLPDSIDSQAWSIGVTTYHTLTSASELTQRVSERFSIYAGHSYYRADSLVQGNPAFVSQAARAGIGYTIAQGISLRLGYSAILGQNTATATGQFKGRTIDGGLDFNRAISLTRRTRFAFATGIAGIQDDNSRLRYFLTGHGSLIREIGRSWTAEANFRRTADFFQIFGQPVLSDTAAAGVSGALGARLMFSASAGYGAGTVGIGVTGSKYTTETGSVGLSVALSKLMKLGMQYGYYHYLFDENAVLPIGLDREMNRQSVRITLDLTAPIMSRARRPNASR